MDPLALSGYSVAAFVAGVVVLDLAVQAVHVTNQSTLYRMMPEARSRLTAGYMTCYFCGGAFGSLLSGYAYSHYGWDGVCYSGAAVSALGLVIWLAGRSMMYRSLMKRLPVSSHHTPDSSGKSTFGCFFHSNQQTSHNNLPPVDYSFVKSYK